MPVGDLVKCEKLEKLNAIQSAARVIGADWRGLITNMDLSILNATLDDWAIQQSIRALVGGCKGVEIFKMEYISKDMDGNEYTATGAVIIPNDYDGDYKITAVYHGTHNKDNALPSKEWKWGAYEGILYATQGAIVIMPDGNDDGYLINEQSTRDVVYMMMAAETWAGQENMDLDTSAARLRVAGWGEGGQAAMAVHQETQTNFAAYGLPDPNTVGASVCCAAPYDWNLIFTAVFQSWPTVPANTSQPHVFAGGLYSFWKNYLEPGDARALDTVFVSEVAAVIEDLFDGGNTNAEIDLALNAIQPYPGQGDIQNLYNHAFGTEIRNCAFAALGIPGFTCNDTLFWNALSVNNTAIGWVPVAPMRIQHGSADVIIPPQMAQATWYKFLSQGATNVTLSIFDGQDKYGSLINSMIEGCQFVSQY